MVNLGHTTDEPSLRLAFTPMPTADERDAIIAALAVVLLETPIDALDIPAAPTSRWRQAGRRSSMRGADASFQRSRYPRGMRKSGDGAT